MKTKAKPLTPKMQDVLNRLKAGAKAHYMPAMGWYRKNSYWFISDNNESVTKQIEGLIARGLLNVKRDSLGCDDTATAKR